MAGCLFEISLPVPTRDHWHWANVGSEVTLLADDVREGRQHLRFRAEAAGAEAGEVELRFERDQADEPAQVVSVRIAPGQI